MKTRKISMSQVHQRLLLFTALLVSGCSPLQFTVKPGNVSVDPGESVSVTAEPSKKGVLKEIGIKYRKVGNNTWEKRVALESKDNIFQFVFDDVREDLEYVLDISKPSEGIGPYVITLKPLRFTVKPGDTSIRPGESVSVTAEPAKQGILNEIEFKYREYGDDTWKNKVTVQSEEGVFHHVFSDVREDLQYTIHTSLPSEGIGPYRITVIPYPKAYKRGYGLAESYRLGKIKDYMLVIELYTLSGTEKDDFLQGFEAAYARFDEAKKGKEYAELLRESITGDPFKQGYEQGQKHVNNEVTDAQIQTLIGRSIGVSRPVTLGWKAGYIKGYTKIELLSKPPIEELHVIYREGQAMYDALRAVIGL